MGGGYQSAIDGNTNQGRNPMLYSEFVSCARHFLQISDSINDGWVLRNHRDYVYLVKSLSQCLSNSDEKDSNQLDDLNEDLESDCQSAEDPPLIVRKWEYHVVHSLTYQVPVLYFNVWNSSGQLLSLEEVWGAIDPNFKCGVLQNRWFTLTQQEHPYLFKPFFYFHPCQTEDFLKCFPNERCNKLIAWLSSIGQVMRIKLNPLYGKKCFFD